MPDLDTSAKCSVFGAHIPGFETVRDISSHDLVIGEPVFFSEQGLAVPHEESKYWSQKVIAVSNLESNVDHVPAHCDLVECDKVVCEKGVFNLANVGFIS